MPVAQNGTLYPFTSIGMGPSIAATTVQEYGSYDAGDITPDAGDPTTVSPVAPKQSTLWYVGAIVVLIVALKFAMEHEKSGIQPSFVGIGAFNFAAIGLMAVLFIVVIKTIVNKYQIPGLTDVVNAV